jgi:phosphatidylglycerophosphatase A
MKQKIESRSPSGFLDYLSLAISTCGVGYLPLAPGTWGSAVGVAIYLATSFFLGPPNNRYIGAGIFGLEPNSIPALITAIVVVLLTAISLVGIWSSTRSISLLGNADPSQVVIDEVMGQVVAFLFVPFGISWPFIFAGFILFRIFDIWKPYPIDELQNLSGGLGVCADDFLAGIYAGACLAVIYAIF